MVSSNGDEKSALEVDDPPKIAGRYTNAGKDSIEWYYREVAAALLNPGTNGKMSGAVYSKLYKEFKKAIDKVFQ